MREIKFRAWDRKEKKMSEPFHFGALTGNCLYNQILGTWRRDANIEGDCEVMQFTGLTDKNGKEIYEGDVIRWPVYSVHGDPEGFRHDEVDYRQGCFWPLETHSIYDKVEILGNIYENPELKE